MRRRKRKLRCQNPDGTKLLIFPEVSFVDLVFGGVFFFLFWIVRGRGYIAHWSICQDFSTSFLPINLPKLRSPIQYLKSWISCHARWVSTSPWRRERPWWTFELGVCGWPWKWRLQLVASFFAKMETVLKSFVSRIPTAQKAINVARRTSLSSAERSIGQGFLANKWINSCIEWWVFKSTNFSLSRSFWLMVARARWKFEGHLLIWENFSVFMSKKLELLNLQRDDFNIPGWSKGRKS